MEEYYGHNDWRDYLAHSWGDSPKQKAKEKAYNHEYWLKNKEEIMKKRHREANIRSAKNGGFAESPYDSHIAYKYQNNIGNGFLGQRFFRGAVGADMRRSYARADREAAHRERLAHTPSLAGQNVATTDSGTGTTTFRKRPYQDTNTSLQPTAEPVGERPQGRRRTDGGVGSPVTVRPSETETARPQGRRRTDGGTGSEVYVRASSVGKKILNQLLQ